jgi:hypothetical protein
MRRACVFGCGEPYPSVSWRLRYAHRAVRSQSREEGRIEWPLATSSSKTGHPPTHRRSNLRWRLASRRHDRAGTEANVARDRRSACERSRRSDRRQLTHHRARDENPDWSPDGTQIAFYSERVGNAEIYVMNADGLQETRVTRDPWYNQAIRWEPVKSRRSSPVNQSAERCVYTRTTVIGLLLAKARSAAPQARAQAASVLLAPPVPARPRVLRR